MESDFMARFKVINRYGLPVHVRCTQLDSDPAY